MNQHTDVTIVGAGVSGLTAAYYLSRSGLHVRLIDSSPLPGGRLSAGQSVSFNHDGMMHSFPIEHAVHGIWSPYSNFLRLLSSIAPALMLRPAIEEAWIRSRGTEITQTRAGSAIRNSLLPAPFHFLQLFLIPQFWTMLGLSDLLRLPWVLYGLFYALAVDPFRENSRTLNATLMDLIRNWGRAIQSFMVGLSRNGLSGNPNEIPLSGFLAFLRFYTLRNRKDWQFSYLPDPSGKALIAPWVEKLERCNTQILLNCSVDNLIRFGNKWRLTSPTEEVDSVHVILATDAYSTERLLANSGLSIPNQPSTVWPQTFAPIVVRIWFDNAPKSRFESGILTGDFILDNFFWLDEIYDSYADWAEKTGGAVIESHIYGPQEVIEREDAWILSMAQSEITLIHPELRGHRVHFTIDRSPNSHTLFSIGPAGNRPEIASGLPDLYLAGDWVSHKHPSLYLERATVSGIMAANEVLLKFGKAPIPVLPPPAPERFAEILENTLVHGGLLISKIRRLLEPTSHSPLPDPGSDRK